MSSPVPTCSHLSSPFFTCPHLSSDHGGSGVRSSDHSRAEHRRRRPGSQGGRQPAPARLTADDVEPAERRVGFEPADKTQHFISVSFLTANTDLNDSNVNVLTLF